MAYLTAAIVMTLSVLEDHSFIVSLFKCDISYLWCVVSLLRLQGFLFELLHTFSQTLVGNDCWLFAHMSAVSV